MTERSSNPGILLDIYKLHAELAEQVSSSREGLNKLYTGMVTAIIAGSVLIHRVAPNSDAMWMLPVLGIAVSLSWMMSLHSVTGRLSAKHAVLIDLESELPFDFLKREQAEFKNLGFVRRKWSGMLMPVSFLVISGGWLATLLAEQFCS